MSTWRGPSFELQSAVFYDRYKGANVKSFVKYNYLTAHLEICRTIQTHWLQSTVINYCGGMEVTLF